MWWCRVLLVVVSRLNGVIKVGMFEVVVLVMKFFGGWVRNCCSRFFGLSWVR